MYTYIIIYFIGIYILYKIYKWYEIPPVLFYLYEESCKFSESIEYNDTRNIRMYHNFINFEKDIFNYLKVDKILLNYYFNFKKSISDIYNLKELIIGKNKDIEKIYFTYKNKIYGLEKNKNKYIKRYYEFGKIFKSELNNLIGIRVCKLFYKLFIPVDNNILYGFKKYNELQTEVISYHINMMNYSLKIGMNALKIKELCNYCNINITNIDKWIKKNKKKIIYWISFTKKNKELELTFYYRDLHNKQKQIIYSY